MKRFCLALVLVGMVAQEPHEGQPAYGINHDGHPQFPNKAPHTCACDKPCTPDQPEDRQIDRGGRL